MTRTLLALPIILLACGGSIPPPNDRLAAAEAAARAAEEVGAQNVPQAALHLKYAREQIDQARAEMTKEENSRAGGILARATADAELAVMLAKEEKSKQEAEKAKEKIRSLGGGR